METKTVSRNIAKGSQDVRFVEVMKVEGHTLRVEICSDTYRRQCHARISRWTGSEWNVVHYIPPETMKTELKLYIKRVGSNEEFAPYFEADRTELLRVADEILEFAEQEERERYIDAIAGEML